MPPELEQEYDELAQANGRTRSYLMLDALKRYAKTEGWQIKQVRRTLDRMERGEEHFIPGEQVMPDFLECGWLTHESLDEARAFYDRPPRFTLPRQTGSSD